MSRSFSMQHCADPVPPTTGCAIASGDGDDDMDPYEQMIAGARSKIAGIAAEYGKRSLERDREALARILLALESSPSPYTGTHIVFQVKKNEPSPMSYKSLTDVLSDLNIAYTHTSNSPSAGSTLVHPLEDVKYLVQLKPAWKAGRP